MILKMVVLAIGGYIVVAVLGIVLLTPGVVVTGVR